MSLQETLRPFFEPRGIVIIGARSAPGFGYSIPISLIKQGWGDRTFLVNPKGGELHGMSVYTSISDVPDTADLAVIIVPAQAVPGVMEEIGKKGIKNVILETAGFAETGKKGKILQDDVLKIARKNNIRVIGPNCVGVVNTKNRFVSVEVMEQALTPGNVAIVAQSGMFGTGILDFAFQRGLFISKVITLGNRMDVDECDSIDFLHNDPDTKVIMIYLEGASDGRRLFSTLGHVSKDKPILILKSGRTSEGSKATASHTGSMSGEDNIYDAAFYQQGAVRAETIEDLLDMARVFSTQPLPAGRRLGIVTSSGSMGVMATDTAISLGLEIPDPSPATVEKVRQGAPDWMNVKNPLDVGPSTKYAAAIEALLEDRSFDMVLAITIIPYTVSTQFKKAGIQPEGWFGNFQKIRDRHPHKPFIICAMGYDEFLKDISDLAGPSTPVIFSPNRAVKALAALWNYKRRIDLRV